mmetsp:Transcript_54042/g.123161  ORF Transcript_54042/g.123161 Transcript_54042/m.123161 type:complete len:418 (+) Transcript_54042:32-1285(+)
MMLGGLVDYGSSDEETKGAEASQPPQPAEEICAPVIAKVTKGRQRKRAKCVVGITALLPPEIRALLEDGTSRDDEEDADDWSAAATLEKKRKAPAVAQESALRGRPVREGHALFALLPKPSEDAPEDAFASALALNVAATSRPLIDPKDGPKEQQNVKAKESESESEDSSDEESGGAEPSTRPAAASQFFSLHSQGSLPATSATADEAMEIPAPLSVAHSTQQDTAVWQEVRSPTGEPYYWNARTGETSWTLPGAKLPSGGHFGVQEGAQQHFSQEETPSQFQAFQGQQETPSHFQEQATGKLKKMRERDLERSLAHGNFDALGQGQAQILYQPDTANWNPHRNGAQIKTKEVKIAHVQYDVSTGETSTVYKPTKVQKRKHQINSLAHAAVERELELMEAKGNALKTKAQTQAKYGW